MKVYLCGPVSKNKDYRKDFEEAKQAVESAGERRKALNIEVCSPADLDLEGWSWELCMRETLRMMLSCHVVVVLNSVKDSESRGSVVEQNVAYETGMPVFAFDHFMRVFDSDAEKRFLGEGGGA
jgi:nucleoside 2-deoxyribosyltransferase